MISGCSGSSSTTFLIKYLFNRGKNLKNLNKFYSNLIQRETSVLNVNRNRLYNNNNKKNLLSTRINSIIRMGSVNCKQYVTTTGADSIGNQPGATEGPTGTYHSTCDTNMVDYTDPVLVCNITDLKENEMQQMDFLENTKILIVKQEDKIFAVGNKCTHYGAPLNTGALGNGRVRCPWHGACFNLTTGDIEDFPGLDSLPCYKVDVGLNGDVKVRARRSDLKKAKRLKDMVLRDSCDDRKFVVVGGGPSGAVCVETLRQEGFTGRIIMICRENNLPYDRVKISKSLDISLDTIQLRTPDFYEKYSIETLLGVEAIKLNISEKSVCCSDGSKIEYDKIYIATGSSAAKAPIQGADLKNVLTIRDHSEANAIAELYNSETNVVCLGSSFIAVEAAAFFSKKVKSVTLIGRENVPFKASFGEEIGQRVLQLCNDNGVQTIMNSGIKEIIGDDEGKVVSVILVSGKKLPCDLLIMGTGSRLNTEFLKETEIEINPNGSINTDMFLKTNVDDVYVGGDIANAPVYSINNQRATIGHYQLAQYHGRVAAINMAGKAHALQAVPFFFTMIFGKGIRYSGYGKHSRVFIDGDLQELKFAAYFLDSSDNVISVASCARDPIVAQFAELQSQGKTLHISEIEGQQNPSGWTTKLREQ